MSSLSHGALNRAEVRRRTRAIAIQQVVLSVLLGAATVAIVLWAAGWL